MLSSPTRRSTLKVLFRVCYTDDSGRCFLSQYLFHIWRNMSKRKLESLGVMIKARRGEKSLRVAAKEIGVGPATLMRIESGHMPDIHTFSKVCQWLEVDPGEFLG